MYWKYTALTRSGKEIKESFAGSRKEAMEIIEQKGLKLISMHIDLARVLKKGFKRKKIPSKVLADFFDDFHNMISLGIGFNEILFALKETSTDTVLIDALDATMKRLNKGARLTEALYETDVFPSIVYSSLNAGENSGKLDEVMDKLSKYFKRQAELKGLLVQSSIYPVIVFLLLIGVMLFVSLHVIPKLQSLLPQQALDSFATKLMMAITFIFQRMWMAFLVIPFVAVYFYYQIKKQRTEKFINFFYKIPLIGTLAKDAALSLYFLNLSLLQRSGVSLLNSFNILDKITAQPFISKKFLKCRDYIIGGTSFWQATEKDAFFPVIVNYTIRRGEETGKIDEYLFRLTDFFEKRVKQRIDLLLTLVQPIMLGICAVFLVLVALAFLVPIYGNLSTIAGAAY